VNSTLNIQEICAICFALGFWMVTLLCVAKMKSQLFFQRAYIDIEGDHVHQIINLKYRHPKIDVQLFSDLPITDKDGNTRYLTITRISKAFVAVYLNNNRLSHISETLEYLIAIAKVLKLEIKAKGYY